MASIDRRQNGTYRARWREYPNGPQHTRTFARKVEAEHFLDGVRGDLARGAYVDPDAGKQAFSSFADEWAAAQDWKATSRETWAAHRRRLVDRLGRAPLSSIDLVTLQGVQTALGKQYARSTTTVTMSYAGAIMRAAFASGRIGRDPTRGLRMPRVRAGEWDGKVGPDQVPTRAEAAAILEAAPAPYRAGIALGIAGLRVGEVIGLSADRLVMERREVVVDRQLQRIGGELVMTTPKAEKARTIVVPGVVAVELRRHLRDHQGDGLLFRGRRGTPMMRRDQFYSSAWKPALAGAGLEGRFTFHALRHFCASTLLAEGAPLTAVAGHLGDTVDTVSRTYVHWLRDDREVPADVLDRVLAPAAEVARHADG
ncbi:MAG: tyrosine-type recombinase/integrase [Acidimicrobiales bacterium]